MNILNWIFGDPNVKEVKKMQPLVDKINALEEQISGLSDEELKGKTDYFKKIIAERLAKGEEQKKILDDLLPEAYAVVREASKRTIGLRHFDVQMIGGIVLHQGKISEMKTGEGKTLVATLPLYLNALTAQGCHLVTVNDYLAKRDADWMGRSFLFFGFEYWSNYP